LRIRQNTVEKLEEELFNARGQLQGKALELGQTARWGEGLGMEARTSQAEVNRLHAELQNECEKHRGEVLRLEEIHNKMAKELQVKEERVTYLTAELEAANASNGTLLKELETTQAQAQAGDAELRRRLAVVEGKLADARDSIESVYAEREDLRGDNTRLKRELIEETIKCETCERALGEARTLVDCLQADLQDAQLEVQKQSLLLEVSEQRITDLNTLNITLEESKASTEAALEQECMRQTRLSERLRLYISAVERNSLITANTVASVVHELEREKETLGINVGDLKGMVTDHASDASTLQSQLRDESEKLRLVRIERDGFETDVNSVGKELQSAVETISEQAREIAELQNLIHKNEVHHATCQAESQRLIEAGESALEIFQEELDELRALLTSRAKEANEVRESFEKSIRILEADMLGLQQDVTKSQQLYADERIVSKNLEREVGECQAEYDNLVRVVEQRVNYAAQHIHSKSTRNVHWQITSYQRELEEYKQRFATEQTKASAFEVECEKLRLMLAQAQREAARVTTLEVELQSLRRIKSQLQADLDAERTALESERNRNEQLQMDVTQLRHTLLHEEAARINAEKDKIRAATPNRSPSSRYASRPSSRPNSRPSTASSLRRDPLDAQFERSSRPSTANSLRHDPLDTQFELTMRDDGSVSSNASEGRWAAARVSGTPERTSPRSIGSRSPRGERAPGTPANMSPPSKSIMVDPLDVAFENSLQNQPTLDPLDSAFEKKWLDTERAKGKWTERVRTETTPGRMSPRGISMTPPRSGDAHSRPSRIPQNVVRKYIGHSQNILAVCVADVEGEEVLFTGSQDWTARGFGVESGLCVSHFEGHAAAISAVCTGGRQSTSLFTTSHDGTAREWSAQSGQLIREFVNGTRSGFSKGMTAVCVEQGMLYTASRDRESPLMRWNLSTGEGEIVQSGHNSAITSLCSGRGRVFSGGLKGELREWLCLESHTGHVFEGHFQEITSLSYHADMLYSGCRDATIKQWSLDSGRCVKTFVGHLSVVRSVCAADVGVLSGSADGTVRLWATDTGSCKGILQNQDSAVTSLAVSGGRLFTACADGSVRLFMLGH